MIQKIFKKNKYKKNEGYAIMFAIILIGAISVMIAGLTSSTYKQLVLSSLAKNSQIAFYQSDTATDCAFYADLIANNKVPNPFAVSGGDWSCGNIKLIVTLLNDGYGSFNLDPSSDFQKTTNPCFSISIKKIPSADGYNTQIKAKGYNICNKDNPKVVEREIEVNY